MQDLDVFFNNYAVASQSDNVKTVADFYADSFMAASPGESATFTNDDKFLEWLKEVVEFNKKSGLQNMSVKKLHSEKLGEDFVNATVTWSAMYAAKPTLSIDFDIHYILRREENWYKIILYISEQDQEKLMKDKGIL